MGGQGKPARMRLSCAQVSCRIRKAGERMDDCFFFPSVLERGNGISAGEPEASHGESESKGVRLAPEIPARARVRSIAGGRPTTPNHLSHEKLSTL